MSERITREKDCHNELHGKKSVKKVSESNRNQNCKKIIFRSSHG